MATNSSSLGSDSTMLMIPAVAARQLAVTVERLRSNLTEWFNFYNGYDPLFTWWMGLPYRHVDAALQGYATFLRDSIAPNTHAVAFYTDSPTEAQVRAASATIAPAPAPKFGEVPDLEESLRSRRTSSPTSCSVSAALLAVAAAAAAVPRKCMIRHSTAAG